MQKLADFLFQPIINILTDSYNYLQNAGSIISNGININKYLAPVSLLGSSWVLFIKTLIGCVSVLVFVYIAKGVFSLYRQLKDGVKWW